MAYQIEKIDTTTKKIISTCFPDYKGKKVYLSTNIPKQLNSFWDGGSKEYYVFYELSTGKIYDVQTNHPTFERTNKRDLETLPKGIVIVNRRYFQGKDLGITIYLNQDDMAPMLPQPETLSDVEEIALVCSRIKNSYGGETDRRFREANRRYGVSRQEWNETLQNLIARGLMRKNNSISPKGRNAIANSELRVNY